MTDMDELTPNIILHGEQLFAMAIDAIIQHSDREILIFDPDLGRGGYTSLARAEALRSFLMKGPHTRLVVLLHESDFLIQRCPRLMQLVRLFSHKVTIHELGEESRAAQDSFVIADGERYLHRFHIQHARFRYGLDDATGVQQLKERFGQILETSRHTISASTLGL